MTRAHKLMTLAAALALAGCAGTPSAPGTTKVPVATPCDAPVPARPVFPADTLTGAEDIFTLGKTLWSDRKAREAYEIEIRTALEGCTARGAVQ